VCPQRYFSRSIRLPSPLSSSHDHPFAGSSAPLSSSSAAYFALGWSFGEGQQLQRLELIESLPRRKQDAILTTLDHFLKSATA
jgi:hypothetical protein